MPKISVIINTYNSEHFLRRCLESVKQFDEIVVCDMHSTDATLQIAEEYGAKIVFHDHTGFVEPARNYAIAQGSNEWVLVVDSDEVAPPALTEYLYNFITGKGDEYAGLMIPRKNYFMGKVMRGSYPDYQLRFFQKSKTDWPPTIHSKPHVDGKVAKIPGRHKELAFDHLPDESVHRLITKFNLYTEKERERRAGQRYSVCGAFFRSMHRFMQIYILKGGFRDGKAGFVNAMIEGMFYKFLTIAKLWEDQLPQK